MYEHIKDTRCLIDFDGTIANSLVWYNVALDEMFMGKLTDKHYIEHYKDFGDAYEIIPGSPWKRILSLLCRYLSSEEMVGARDDSNPYLPRTYCYNMGVISAMLKVAYDAQPIGHTPDNIYLYRTSDNKLIGCVLDDIATVEHVKAVHAASIEQGMDDWNVLVPNEYAAMSQSDLETYSGKMLYISDVENELEHIFETKSVRILSELSFEQLGIAPVIEFCRQYKAAGGSIAIQSGSNKRLVKTMISTLGIEDLFDGVFCSPDLDIEESADMSPWTYKTLVIDKAKHSFDDERACFVVGDTKGDAFGAYENSMPFFLCWRGYPSDPSKLASAEGTLEVGNWTDITQELLDEHPGIDFFADGVGEMMNFADVVGQGKVSAPRLS